MAQANIQELYQMLDAADRAGDTEGAQYLAGLIQNWESEQQQKRMRYEQETAFQEMLTEQAKDISPVQAALIGAGKTFTDIGRGAQGIYYGLTGDEERVAELKAEEAEAERLYDPLRREQRGATFVGEMLPYLATAPLGGTAGATAAAARGGAGAGRALGMYAGEQAALGALQGGLGAPVGEAGTGALIGGALGGALPFAGRGAANLADRGRGAIARAGEMTAAGVPLTPGQRLGSNLLTRLEEVYSRVPGLGSAFESVGRGQQRAVNRMAAESIGETAEEISGDVLARAGERIGRQFDEIIAEKPLYQFGRGFLKTARRLNRTIVDDELDAPVARKLTQRLVNRAKAGGGFPAKEYQKINTRIGKKLKSLTIDPDEREALVTLKEALDDMVEAQMPRSRLEALQQARGQWRNLRDLEKVTDTVSGNVSGAKLANRLERLRGPRALAGDTPISQAGRIGRELRPLVPNSGTPTGMLPFLGAGALMGTEDYGGAGAGLGMAALAPWLYRGAGRALATPLQRGATTGLQALSQPAAINVGRSLGAGLAPGLLD